MITRIVQSFFRTLSPQISPNQIFSVSDETLIKRFVKLLETLVGGAQWIAARSNRCATNQYKQFVKDNKAIHLWNLCNE